jgi:hypothetical protein
MASVKYKHPSASPNQPAPTSTKAKHVVAKHGKLPGGSVPLGFKGKGTLLSSEQQQQLQDKGGA